MHAAIPSYPIPAESGTVGPAVDDVMAKLMGFSIGEDAGSPAAAKVRLREATSTGTILAVIDLEASSSSTKWFGPEGKRAIGGVYVELVSGTVEGSVTIA